MSRRAHNARDEAPSRGVCRRQFLAQGVRLGAGLALPGALAAGARDCLGWGTSRPDLRGKVAIARRDGLVSATTDDLRRRGIEMLDRSVCQLTGLRSARDAWGALFDPKDRVGIKTNVIAGPRLSPRRGLVEAVVDGLRKAGVPDDNILIFDRFEYELEVCGFAINHRGGVRCFGTDSLRGSGYEEEVEVLPHMGSCFSKIITRLCTALVNVCILKDHDLAGVSVAMKNFYGVIHNPNKYHLNNCDPYVAELAAHAQIRGKLRLNVCDAIRPQYDGGPSYKPRTVWDYNTVFVAGDMAALDRLGADIIEAQRRAKGLPSLDEERRAPKYIHTAVKLGVGVGDPARIQRIEV